MTDNRWHFANRFPDKCVAEVSRKGESQPCDKPAYALAFGEDESEYHWPVCIYHARGRALVPLAEVLNRHVIG